MAPENRIDDPLHGQNDGSEKLVAKALGELLECLNAGEVLDEGLVRHRYPDLAGELLLELRTLQSIDREGCAPPLGTLGDYTLRRQIGRGGMGVVYEAWQGSVDRPVALKVLPAGVAADDKAFHRFMREARTAAKLSHPNVVGVYGMGQEENTPYYAMEYVEGETLAQVLRRMKQADESVETPFGVPRDDVAYYSKLARAFADVADGLQHAHSKGVVHRDIKPSNLILDAEGRLRILDFGLARLEGQESLTLSGDFVGTPAYMSPEQARRQKIPVDHRTDIYSLGATLYELLTHEQPFGGKDHADTLSRIIERDPRPPRQLNSRTPQDLETIVLKCLRKDAADRYGTAEALGQDLRRFVRGDPVEAQAQSVLEKVTRRLWQQRLVLAGVCVLLLLGFFSVGIANVFIARARDRALYDLYVADIHRANESWNAGNMRGFERLLEAHVPGPGDADLRGWEWHYLDSLRHTGGRTFEGSAPMLSIDWSPDDRLVAYGDKDGAVVIRETETWQEQASWTLGEGAPAAISWSPDSELLAIVSSSGLLEIRDGTGQLRSTTLAHANLLKYQDGVVSVDWHPGGEQIASSGHDATVKVWRWLDGELVLLNTMEEPSPVVRSVCWSHDGRYLAATSSWHPIVLVVWESDSWQEVCRSERQRSSFTTVAWSPESDRLAVSTFRGTTEIWDPSACTRLASFGGHKGGAWSVAWNPEGNRLASGASDGIVRIHGVDGDLVPVLLRGHRRPVRQVVWSGDGDRLASAGSDGTVRIWDPKSGQRHRALPGEHPAAWSPDGAWIAMEDKQSRRVLVVDALTGEPIGSVPCLDGIDSVKDLTFSPDGRLLAVSQSPGYRRPGGGTRVWDWRGEIEVFHTKGAKLCAAWSPDGTYLAAGGWKRLIIVDGKTGEHVREVMRGSGRWVQALAWSPDGQGLAMAGRGALKVWDTGTWKVRHDLRRYRSSSSRENNTRHDALSWSPDSQRLVSGNSEGDVIVWDAASGTVLFSIPAHSTGVKSCAWSPDGERIASGSSGQVVKIWDARSGEELLTLDGPTGGAYSLAWHLDGEKLLSAGHSVLIWDATGRQEER